MLREIKHVRQEQGSGRRRWFESEGFELVVWFGATGAVDGFQVCYDFGEGERALTWRPQGGFVHSAVDDGTGSPFKNVTPVLVPNGVAPWSELVRRFEARSETLESTLRDFVREKLMTQANGGGAGRR